MSTSDWIALASVLVAVVGSILGFVWRLYVRARRQLRIQGKDHKETLISLGQVRQQVKTLEDKAKKDDETIQALRITGIVKEGEIDRLNGVLTDTTHKMEALTEDADRKERLQVNQVKRIFRLEGRLWQKKALQGIPAFRPLADRKTPILSMLNLKGGVGKTTITAHLAAALAERGHRVLMVDLDLQGSLSSLFIPQDRLAALASKSQQLLQHYFKSTSENGGANLLPYVMRLSLPDCDSEPSIFDRLSIVATSDHLAYAELNLTMQWLLRMGKRDTRFLLRKGLHQKRITNRFDIILLDCPPLINTCCVNALAASDYVLIPVTPSQKAAERVPKLLWELRNLYAVVNPDLQVAGIVANRMYMANQMTAKETDLWDRLLQHCKDQNELPVHAFHTLIPQTAKISNAESEFTPPVQGSDLALTFGRLAQELEERFPNDCRRSALAP